MSNEPERLKRNKAYPLADAHPLTVRALRLNVHPLPKLGAVWTGEKRPPKKGEWYLSGAVIEAYQAPNDLSTPCHIARIVEVVTTTLETFKELPDGT